MKVVGEVSHIEAGAATGREYLVLLTTNATGETSPLKIALPTRDGRLALLRNDIDSGDIIESTTIDGIVGLELQSFKVIRKLSKAPGISNGLRIDDRRPKHEISRDAFDAPGELDGDLAEIFAMGEIVFSLSWDAGDPYGCGVTEIILGQGIYCCDTEAGKFGPFRTFKEALAWLVPDFFNNTMQSITCSELTGLELAELITLWDEVPAGYEVKVNGQIWRTTSEGRLVR
jgi:hypothetical protein